MIFTSPLCIAGNPIVNATISFNISLTLLGIPLISKSPYTIGFQSLDFGTPRLVGVSFTTASFINKPTYFQAIWGKNAYQNVDKLTIFKQDFLGLTPKELNSSTALLAGLINNLLANFPTSESLPIQAYIFSTYIEGDYEYIDVVVKIFKPLETVDFEIQYPEDPFDPDLFTM